MMLFDLTLYLDQVSEINHPKEVVALLAKFQERESNFEIIKHLLKEIAIRREKSNENP